MARREFPKSVKHWTGHGRSRCPEYRAWINMITRCENANAPGYHNYGGRGISVCAVWRSSFLSFLSEVGDRPSSLHSLDRIDNSKNYEPGNVRWATRSEQNRNLRTNHLVEFEGAIIPLIQAVEARGLNYNTVLYRLKRGKSVDEALS